MAQELRNAISCNDVVKLQKIFCTTDVKLNDYRSYNPLIHACIKGSPVVVGALAKAGSDVNVKADISNYSPYKCHASARLWNAIECMKTVTPLILAVVDRNFKLVKKLVQDCGADVNATNEDGTAPLHHVPTIAKERKYPAKVQNQQEIADLLLKAGAEVNVHNKCGETPLHRAAIRKDLDYSRRLLQNGARVDLADNQGFTVLHIAAEQAYTELLVLLLQQEGTRTLVNQKTHDDATPLHVAITAKADTRYYVAADEDWVVVVRMLIENGADLTSQKDGLTPLHLAAEAGFLDIVKMLVEAGADICTEAPFTCLTPVDMAVHRKKQDVIDYFKYMVPKAAESKSKEGGRPKRESPSAEQAKAEDSAASQQTETPVEEMVAEGAVGGIQQVLVIRDGDSTDED
ncbi:ankyrin repeat domain-containing protein 61-like [Branchiostoma floridae x Branchiostoma japonicum]